MGLLVEDQVALHVKALVTDITDEGLLSGVDALVLLPVALVAEGLGAAAAGVWLLAVVLPHVLQEVGGSVESLVTFTTFMFPGVEKADERNSVVDPDPYSGALWIRIRIPNTDPVPHM